MASSPDAAFDDFIATVAVTRLVMGPKMRVQAPPNLVSRSECLTLVGAGWMIQSAASNTILQTLVRDEMRGRVMAFYAVAVMGTAPFGSLLAGAAGAGPLDALRQQAVMREERDDALVLEERVGDLDAQRRVVGALNLHDLLRARVV